MTIRFSLLGYSKSVSGFFSSESAMVSEQGLIRLVGNLSESLRNRIVDECKLNTKPKGWVHVFILKYWEIDSGFGRGRS